MKKPDKGNCAECVGDIITLIRYKLIIRNVTHHFKKECTSNDNEKSLSFLFRKVVIKVTAMKEIHKKSVFVLINLI